MVYLSLLLTPQTQTTTSLKREYSSFDSCFFLQKVNISWLGPLTLDHASSWTYDPSRVAILLIFKGRFVRSRSFSFRLFSFDQSQIHWSLWNMTLCRADVFARHSVDSSVFNVFAFVKRSIGNLNSHFKIAYHTQIYFKRNTAVVLSHTHKLKRSVRPLFDDSASVLVAHWTVLLLYSHYSTLFGVLQ